MNSTSVRNTKVRLLYRDASNYKMWTSFIMSGEATASDVESWRNSLVARTRLKVPKLAARLGVDIPDPRLDMIKAFGESDDDHPWVEMHSVEGSGEKATIDLHIDRLSAILSQLSSPEW